MRRPFVRVRLAAALAAIVVSTACQRTSAEPDAAALAVNEPFFLKGSLTATDHPWGYRIRGEPGTSYRVNEAHFTIGPETELRRADGTPATAADLVVGRELTLWITGPIAESHPVQVRAQRIVLKTD